MPVILLIDSSEIGIFFLKLSFHNALGGMFIGENVMLGTVYTTQRKVRGRVRRSETAWNIWSILCTKSVK